MSSLVKALPPVTFLHLPNLDPSFAPLTRQGTKTLERNAQSGREVGPKVDRPTQTQSFC